MALHHEIHFEIRLHPAAVTGTVAVHIPHAWAVKLGLIPTTSK